MCNILEATMQNEVMFAGFGGQGIMLMGKILAHAAMEAGYEVVWIPSYGPEMRGGTAYCTVVISDKPIGSPIIRNPKHLVAMNGPSYDKFSSAVKPGGIIFANGSLIKDSCGREDIDELSIDIMTIAKDIGSIKVANIIALSAFVARSKIVDFELLRDSVKAEFSLKEKLIPIKMKAVEAGQQAAAV